MAKSAWKPVLHGARKDRAIARAQEIAAALEKLPPSAHAPAWALAEQARLHAELARVTGGGDHAARSERAAREAVELLRARELPLDLHGGRMGAAWLIDHAVTAELALDTDEHDVISGLAGFGAYALERRDLKLVDRIVDRLRALACEQPSGVAWHTPASRLAPAAREKFPEGVFDLGVAHGAAGVIAFLARAPGDNARALLDAALAFVLAQRLPEEDRGCFPAWVARAAQTPVRAARSGWCYGAPGMAIALLRAGREEAALSIARASAERPVEDARVSDAGLCHGAAGLGHIFARLFNATGDRLFERTAAFWFERALAMPIGDDRSFLSGETGVALALLSAATPLEPAWDHLLLLDL